MSSRALIELLRGKGAHADPLACVEDISAELARRKVNGFPHSIAQLLFHMNYWMDYDLRRAHGEKPRYPEHNSESFPSTAAPASDAEWHKWQERFAALISETAALAGLSQTDLDHKVEATHPSHQQRADTLEALLWQLAAHNSYHTGQIAMIRRALGAWPPRGGGDTW
ncbi:MAG: DinB family protein [Candidatus Sulfotelmatobacter sp.]